MNILQSLQHLFGGVHLTDHDVIMFLLGVVASGIFGRISLRKAYRTVRRTRRVADDIIP